MPVNTISADQVQRGANSRSHVITSTNARQPKQPRNHRFPRYQCRAVQLKLDLNLIKEGEVIALDVEGVELDNEVSYFKKGIGRVSIVNEAGKVVYDTFAYYPDGVSHRPSPKWLELGVYWPDIKPGNGARPVAEVLINVEKACRKAGAIVCHSIKNEIRYMSGGKNITTDHTFVDIGGFDLTQFRTHDTQLFEEYRVFATGTERLPSLKVLAPAVLGRSIQVSEHSSIEDAQATMDLFLRRRAAFEAIASPISTALSDLDEEMVSLASRTSELSLATTVDDAATIQSSATITQTIIAENGIAEQIAKDIVVEEKIKEMNFTTLTWAKAVAKEKIVEEDVVAKKVIAEKNVCTEETVIAEAVAKNVVAGEKDVVEKVRPEKVVEEKGVPNKTAAEKVTFATKMSWAQIAKGPKK